MLSLIPISDANPARRKPFVTLGLIAANVYFFFQTPDLGTGAAATRYFVQNAPIPCQIPADCPAGFAAGVIGPQAVAIPERPLTSFLAATLLSIFLHAGLLHIGGNMLFLWIFGNNVEDHLGHVKFLLFYLAGGVIAAFAHVLTHLDSVLPAVGASGAVAAVMGAYIVLYPRARVNVLVPIFFIFTIVQMSAVVVLGLWFVYQFIIAAQEISGATEVAWMAHVGGFVFGAVGIFLLGGRPHPPRSRWDRRWELR
ncbi:MAG: rhomboid family intramembrane serine protease [Actinomycetota bacterium]